MKITVTVKTRSKRPGVTKIDRTHFAVSVNELPIEGRANKAVIKALADFFQIPPGQVELISGHRSKIKIFEIY